LDQIGKRIREYRRKRSLTLEQLAQAADLSVSFLSEIERGLAQPSFASIKKIRKALGVSLLSVLGQEDEQPNGAFTANGVPRDRIITGPTLVRADQRKKLAYPGQPGFYELLTPDLNRQLEVLYFTMEPDSDTGPEPLLDPSGEKCMVILNGEVEFRVGDEVFHMNAGDSLSYPADAPVSWHAAGPDGAEGILIITPPSF
jgi:transcriptional regulator with XRE-family HTH domain